MSSQDKSTTALPVPSLGRSLSTKTGELHLLYKWCQTNKVSISLCKALMVQAKSNNKINIKELCTGILLICLRLSTETYHLHIQTHIISFYYIIYLLHTYID